MHAPPLLIFDQETVDQSQEDKSRRAEESGSEILGVTDSFTPNDIPHENAEARVVSCGDRQQIA